MLINYFKLNWRSFIPSNSYWMIFNIADIRNMALLLIELIKVSKAKMKYLMFQNVLDSVFRLRTSILLIFSEAVQSISTWRMGKPRSNASQTCRYFNI